MSREILRRLGGLARVLGCVLAAASSVARSDSAEVPIKPGVKFVLAVSNAQPDQKPGQKPNLEGLLQGDYEMLVSLDSVGALGVTQVAHIDGLDEKGIHQRGKVPRLVPPADIERAREQILGFHMVDPRVVAGTTSLGPSLGIVRELREKGKVQLTLRNFAKLDPASATLTPTNPSRVKFPVIINGTRTELDAMRASGRMLAGGSDFPVEMILLDHPKYPLTLRIAWGENKAGYPFKPRFAREIVRINYDEPSVAQSMEKSCRAELIGVYFDFNRDTLKPESDPALDEIAKAIAQSPQRALRIEGHTDNVGNDQYNDDLSRRRAAAVKTALVQRFKVSDGLLSTAGYGERKPVETNDTLAGRARNRRVELVCAQ